MPRSAPSVTTAATAMIQPVREGLESDAASKSLGVGGVPKERTALARSTSSAEPIVGAGGVGRGDGIFPTTRGAASATAATIGARTADNGEGETLAGTAGARSVDGALLTTGEAMFARAGATCAVEPAAPPTRGGVPFARCGVVLPGVGVVDGGVARIAGLASSNERCDRHAGQYTSEAVTP